MEATVGRQSTGRELPLFVYRSVLERHPYGFALLEMPPAGSPNPELAVFVAANAALYSHLGEWNGDLVGVPLAEAPAAAFLATVRDAIRSGASLHEEVWCAATGRCHLVSTFWPAPGLLAVLLLDVAEARPAEEALRWELRVSAALAQLYEPLISPRSTIEDIAATILAQAKALTGSAYGYVSAMDPNTGEYLEGATPPGREEADTWPLGPAEPADQVSPSWGRAPSVREAFYTNDPASHPAFLGLPVDHALPRRCLCVPVRLGEELVGQICVADSDRDYGDRELAALHRLAWFYALAIQRKRTEDALRYLGLHDPLTGLYNRAYFSEEMRRLEGGRDYPITVVSTDIDDLKLINDTMGHRAGDELLKACAAAIRACFRKSDVVARTGGDEFAAILPRTDEQTARSLRQRLLEQIAEHNRERPDLPLSLSWGERTAAGPELPLEEALKLADQNMYGEKMARGGGGRVVEALLAALVVKDFVGEGHTRRVRDLAVRLADQVGLSTQETDDLALLAEVHDLGKVGIGDDILFKVGPLTDAEWEAIKQHPSIGRRIARSSPQLARVADLILHHHEWWNGQGYPDGLRGEEIPLVCRVFALADAYDALTSDRPYRPALTKKLALDVIQRDAGLQFDPRLVETFVWLMEESA